MVLDIDTTLLNGKRKQKRPKRKMEMNKLLLILSLLLAACTTTPTPIENATPTQGSHIIAHNEQREDTTATVIVVRDAGTGVASYPWGIAINDRVVGKIAEEEKITLYVQPGDLSVAVAHHQDSIEWLSVDTTIAKGETQYFRVGYHTDSAMSIPILGLFMRDESRFLFIEPYEKEWDEE
jgi:hypothetical protein